MRALLHLAALMLATGAAQAGTTPPTMVGNVYRFSEAAAVLEICFASDAFRQLPAERAEALRGLSGRLTRLVKAIGQYYEDGDIHPTYEATRARIAADSELRLHVRNHYQYCGERLATQMEKYVVENELLLGRYFSQPKPRPAQKRPPEPPPAQRAR